jgi:hypothetical protein
MRRWAAIATIGLVISTIGFVEEGVRAAHAEDRRRTGAIQLSKSNSEMAALRRRVSSLTVQLASAKSEATGLQGQVHQLTSENADLTFGNLQDQADALSWRDLIAFFQPTGITAICRDTTYSHAVHSQGQCSYQGGIGVSLRLA